MITQPNIKTIALTTSTTVLMSEINTLYYVTCSEDLSGDGNVAITASGTPKAGTTLVFVCNFNTTNYTATTDYISFFGVEVPAELAAKKFLVYASYQASAWQVFITASLQNTGLIDAGLLLTDSVTTAKIVDLAVTTAKLNDLAVTIGKIAANAVTNAKLAQMTTMTIKGNDSGSTADPQDLSLTEVRTMLDQDVTLIGDITGTATQTAATGVTTVATTLSNSVVDVEHLKNTLQFETLYIPVSFEANEKGAFFIKFAYDCEVIEYMASVTKAIAATDDATIVLADNTPTTMTGSTLTLPASSAYGTNVNVTSGTITSNYAFTAGQTMRITTAKTTAGGMALLSIKIQRV